MDAETQALVEQTARQAAQIAVNDTLIKLGVDHRHPIDAQKDMAFLREMRDTLDDADFRADMLHLRRWRRAMEAVQTKGVLATVGLVIAGLGALLVLGFKTKLGIGG